MKNIFFLCLFAIFIISCSSSPSYEVRVINATGETISIDYSSKSHKDGPVKASIDLEDGQQKVIITTIDFDQKLDKMCDLVAESVVARRLSDNKESSLKWCDSKIKEELVDIGQYQFMIRYTKQDF